MSASSHLSTASPMQRRASYQIVWGPSLAPRRRRLSETAAARAGDSNCDALDDAFENVCFSLGSQIRVVGLRPSVWQATTGRRNTNGFSIESRHPCRNDWLSVRKEALVWSLDAAT
jgi:hypothetical protein